MKKGFLVLTILLVAALLFGCCGPAGGANYPTPTGTMSPTVEPSQLISKADAEAIVGNGLTPNDNPSAKVALPTSGMKFVYYDASTQGGRFLMVSLYEWGFFGNQRPAAPKAMFDALKTPVPTSPKPTATPNPSATAAPTAAPTPTPTVDPMALTPVQGIGEEAYFAAPGLHIYYNGYYIVLSVGTIDSNTAEGQANREVLTALGKKVVENLKSVLAASTPVPAATAAQTAPAASAAK